MEFVTVIEKYAGHINIPQNVYRLIGNTLPRGCYLHLEIGNIFPAIANRRTQKLMTYTQAICTLYGGVASVEVSITYAQNGSFNLVRILPKEDEDDASSDSTDSDYRSFLANYVSGDDGSGDEPTEVSVVTDLSFGEDDN